MNTRSLHIVAAIACLSLAVSAWAAPIEPTPNPAYRTLPSDYVRSWNIFNDANANGILDPLDQKVALVQNWWSPVSGHTEANYTPGPYGANSYVFPAGDDIPSAPMNFASETDPSKNYWLPRQKNAIHFYMNFSQFDNNDFQTFVASGNATVQQVVAQRNLYRNGWGLGYVVNDVTKDINGNFINDQSLGGKVAMDVYVHNGESTVQIAGYGTRRSNPQVALSDDIDPAALDNTAGPGTGTQYHPPQFDPVSKTYSYVENLLRLAANGQNAADLTAIVNSMELREVDPAALAGSDVIDANSTPNQVAANETDHVGAAYEYQDAFLARHLYVNGSTDGGVLAGLSGWDQYDPNLNNWGDQQVIRVDISPETLTSGDPNLFGNINTVVFYDFTDQVNPTAIVLDLADTNLFPENRFFIASADVPEPTTTALLLGGGLIGLLVHRRRRKGATA